MKTTKTSELTGAALDWAVAVAEYGYGADYKTNKYSTDWAQGGPIIERENIGLTYAASIPCWYATSQKGKRFLRLGDTPLIAAMRCYVASKMGDAVEIPEELLI